MLKKYIYIVTAMFLIAIQTNAQLRQTGSGSSRQMGTQRTTGVNTDNGEEGKNGETADPKDKPKIPSIIKVWELSDQGSLIKPAELDTTLWFYHNYLPFNQRSISNTFTGNNGGAYLSNDFFKRTYNSDFYFARSFDAYWLTPSQIQYFNTTTPYTLLDYSQSENRLRYNETRFNVFHSQNINKNLNFEFIYNQTRSAGQYLKQENKFHNIGVISSYKTDKFLSHSGLIFNRVQTQENGGIQPNQDFNNYKTDELTVKITDDAINKVQNNTFYTINEYRVGKTIESEPDTAGFITETFIPRVGFIYEFEYSGNKRKFTKEDASAFFDQVYINRFSTTDSIKYNRVTNLFQIKFYEAPDRKYTFGKRAYIGHDNLRFHSSTLWNGMNVRNANTPSQYTNTYVGGGIFRDEGKFWQWAAEGRIYLAGLRAGQTELHGFINKPLKIGNDTTSLRVEGSLKTIVPEYFDEYFYSNHFQWTNNFDNINEMTIRSSIHSKAYKTTIGANYSLIGNYIYNNAEALPAQASSELLILSAYLNKDFDRKHWLVRTQLLVQKASNDNYIHLPAFAGFASFNYRTIVSKVLYTQLGVDARYNSAFYADAYEPATSRFFLQNEQRIGNFPYVDLHVNLKLKRTRVFFVLMNAASGLAGNNYFVAPDYPYYRRTYRIGVAWSFYD
ncbi:MAG: putative porin [Prolixibacteraceae bacterium]|nr:putative porin [Prolixibacteraceae bacterium]